MGQNKSVSFDKLDAKLIGELPLLSEVLISTMTKVSKQFEPYCVEVDNLLQKELRHHKHWSIDYTEKNIFYPFVSNKPGRKGIVSIGV